MKTTGWRLIIVALVVSIFAIGMSTLLNYFKFRATTAEMLKSRVLVVADDIDRNVVSSLALGLSFSEISTLQPLIEAEQAAADSIRQIIVFDTKGKILYSTVPDQMGGRVDSDWLKTASTSGEGWLIEGADLNITGRALSNSFDLRVGYVALAYSPDHMNAAAVMGKELLLIAIAVLLFAMLLIFSGLPPLIRRLDKDLKAMADVSELSDAIAKVDKELEQIHQTLEVKS
ncbi:hypothetical protein [Motiliproteus sp. MSK22-1]|uniref:hypothetical protein n=1 Tax=Motiliproteus sp. MSK22-1 TaxID=1897630 RepID=UPI00097651ED|nr:hypothetical protein [Motiliproteus sp. MSK22-1]OMH30297.1 hypothetical protein BGP75_18070 [Motiliproteus sp. MSK22-1]